MSTNQEQIIKVTVRKFHQEGKSRVEFTDYSTVPSSFNHKYIHYDLEFKFDNQEITVPFYFENGRDVKVMKESNEDGQAIFSFSENRNEKKMVRFGVDDVSYEIEEISQFDKLDVCSGVSFDREGIKIKFLFSQEVNLNLNFKDPEILLNVVKAIQSTYQAQNEYFPLDEKSD